MRTGSVSSSRRRKRNMENNDRTGNAFSRYSDALGLEPDYEYYDSWAYDMSQRSKLAGIVVKDGKEVVVDLGSYRAGMTHALKEAGVEKVISTEHVISDCKRYIRKINDYVVLCDSFRLPFRESRPSLCILSEPDRTPLKPDALVSYMFLGQNMGQNRKPYQLGNPDGLKDIFKRLLGPVDTVYSVELQTEWSRLFDPKWAYQHERTLFEPEEIEKRLKGALSPEFEVESLGSFGIYHEENRTFPRFGFKFTKKRREK